jgi:hypothetical protein
MALTAGYGPIRRGRPASGGEFGYPVAPGEKVFRGGLIAINSSGYAQRVQTSGSVTVIGICDRDYDNTASSAPSSQKVVGMRGCYALTVAGATFSNINANVYATDDNTLQLSSTSALLVGTLAGFEGGQSYVTMAGG